MEFQDTVWKTDELTKTYLTGIRGAIPLAQEQIDMMLRLIDAACPDVTAVLDLGCGDGILGQAVLDQYPHAQGIFVDFSEPMLEAAQARMESNSRCTFMLLDYGKKEWANSLPQDLPRYEVIVSGFSIHHQPDERKKEIYTEIYNMLAPGGIFLNLEHVASHSLWVERRFEEFFIDALFAFHQGNGSDKTRQQVDDEFYGRPDKAANKLAPVESQCNWLRQTGFVHVDCYLKVFELALFGGIKAEI
jgi:tRNA (cmo5U34)-methyltransferase